MQTQVQPADAPKPMEVLRAFFIGGRAAQPGEVVMVDDKATRAMLANAGKARAHTPAPVEAQPSPAADETVPEITTPKPAARKGKRG